MNSNDLIEAFVARLSKKKGYSGLRVDSWPDQSNRTFPEIDAIAGPFAIEHTSVDRLPNQRRDTDWFAQIAKPLRAEFRHTLPFRLCVHVEYGSIKIGQDWRAITRQLREWILDDAPQLPDGNHVVNHPQIPFLLHVTKLSQRRPTFLLGRLIPKDDCFAARIKTQLDRKAEKLARYHGSKITILLVENDDIALTDTTLMLQVIREAYPGGPPTGVHQIWYADTSIPEDTTFTRFLARANSVAISAS